MFAVLHIEDFALQALLRNEPHAAQLSFALVDPELRPPRLIACTQQARTFGVEVGQTAPQALARCPRLRCLTPRPDAENEATAGLLATAFSISPFVETTALGVCTIQIAGVAPDRHETELLRALEHLASLGFYATAGTGPTPLLALYAARNADPLLMIGNERAFLGPLPIAAAEPPEELVSTLAGWGVRTLGDLTDLSKASVAQRLGPAGLALWERAAGEVTRPLNLITPPPAFSASMENEDEFPTLEPLLFILRRFVDRLMLELQTAALAAAELTLALTLTDRAIVTRTLRLPEPTTQPDTVFRTLETYLQNTRTAHAVCALRFDITPIRISARQHGLFDRALRDPHRFAESLARIAALVGADRVGTPVLKDSHRPDAFTLIPPPSEIPLQETTTALKLHLQQGLVLRRFRPPLPATVELREGPDGTKLPNYIWTPLVEGSVHALNGPWKKAGDWWQTDQSWERDEWDIELNGLYRLIHTADDRWYLEGEYD